MPKQQPGPVFTLQPVAPAKPGWWPAHRHQVIGTGALALGFLLGQNASAPGAINTPSANTTPAVSSTPTAP